MAVKILDETTEIREVPRVLALAPTANSLDDIFVAPTAFADGIAFRQTGREVVTVWNTDAAPQTFTIKSVADSSLLNRTGDVGAYSLGADEMATITIHPTGFKDTNNRVTIVMSANTVKVAVNRVQVQV